MASLNKLNTVILLFCLIFGLASYSPLARWILISDNLENGNFKDLTSNNNLFQAHDSDGDTAEVEALLGSFHITAYNNGEWCGTVNSLSSATEYGVSVWMKNGGLRTGSVIFRMLYDNFDGPNYALYYGVSGPQSFAFDSTIVPFNEGSWLFLVFYWYQSGSNWVWKIVTPGFATITIKDTSAGYPGEHICLGHLAKDAYFYEVQVFKNAIVSSQVVTLHDFSNAAYDATTSSCLCGRDYCHSEMGCLVTDTYQCPALCACSSKSVCSACKDSTYDTKDNCKCKIGYVLKDTTCVLGDFYIDLPTNCVAGESLTKCTQCESNYFLYDKGSDTTCLACGVCSGCDQASCYLCTKIVSQAGNDCRVDSYGYQLGFSYPNIITISLTHPLAANYVIKNLKATSVAGDNISTTAWTLSAASTSSKFQIITDLNSSQLPINIDFNFGKQED